MRWLFFRRAIALLLPKRNGTGKSRWPSSGGGSGGNPKQKAPAMPGLLYSPYPVTRSVSRNHRSAPVEAVDQFGSDGLNKFLGVVELASRAQGSARCSDNTNLRQPIGIKLGKAILGLPEQAGQPVRSVLEPAAKEPTGVGVS